MMQIPNSPNIAYFFRTSRRKPWRPISEYVYFTVYLDALKPCTQFRLVYLLVIELP